MDTVTVARALSVADDGICTIAADVDGVPAANGASTTAESLQALAQLVADNALPVPTAATFAIDEIRAVVELQAG